MVALEEKGGSGAARLEVPTGRWLTGSFNLTSHFVFFLHHGWVILAFEVCYPPISSNFSSCSFFINIHTSTESKIILYWYNIYSLHIANISSSPERISIRFMFNWRLQIGKVASTLVMLTLVNDQWKKKWERCCSFKSCRHMLGQLLLSSCDLCSLPHVMFELHHTSEWIIE